MAEYLLTEEQIVEFKEGEALRVRAWAGGRTCAASPASGSPTPAPLTCLYCGRSVHHV
jgi:hypothetical protein